MPKACFNYFCMLLFFCISSIGFSQQMNLSFNHINHNNGLSETMNAYVFKDSRGFIWISSNDGLNRYDGKTVVHYRTGDDANSLKGKIINSNFFEDDEANIWFCSYDAINCYQRKTNNFKSYTINDKSGKPVRVDYYGFYLDDQKRFWFTNEGRLYLFNTKSKQSVFAGILAGNRGVVKKVKEDTYIGYFYSYGESTIDKFIVEHNKLSNVPFFENKKKEVAFNNIYSVAITNDSLLWMGCNEGLVKINTVAENLTIYNQYDKSEVNEVRGLAVNNKYVFAASSNGLVLFEKALNRFSSRIKSEPSNSYSLAVNTLNDLYLDYENILWVSIWNKGIDYANINKSCFHIILNQNTTAIENAKIDYRAITIGSDGNFWIASDHGLIVADKDFKVSKIFTVSKTGRSISSNRLTYLMHDSAASKIWICSYFGGIDYYDEKTKQFNHVAIQKGEVVDFAFYILKFKNGRLIASTENGLFEIVKNKSGFELCRSADIANEKRLADCYTLFETSNGLLLVANREKFISVFKIKPEGLQFIKELDIEATTTVYYEEPISNTVWVTTSNGLIKLNTVSLKYSFVQNIPGIAGEYLYSVLPDSDNLWIGSGRGIVRLNTNTFNSRTYTANDGIAILDFWDLCGYKLPDNRLMMGGSGGINIFNPSEIYKDTLPSQVQLTSIKVNDQFFELPISLSDLKEINLNFNQNTFSFEFADLHLSNTGHNHFQYRIDELDSNWVDNGTNNFARFAQLSHGNYNFKVRAANADGLWSKPLMLAIHIKPPWYKTWWAYTLDVLLAAGLIVWITVSFTNEKLRKQRIIIEKQQAVEAERTRISAEMHDDLGASLSTMKLMCDVVKTKLEGTDSTEEIDFIAHTSNDLVYKMREIIWSMNSKYDSLDDLILYIEKYAKDYLTTSNIKYQGEVPDVVPELTLHGEMRRNIFLVVKETLHNTFKHAKADKVTIGFQLINQAHDSTKLLLTILDNGVGIDLDSIHRFGNGLDNMRKRMESVGGTYTIANRNGTVTTLAVDLENNKV